MTERQRKRFQQALTTVVYVIEHALTCKRPTIGDDRNVSLADRLVPGEFVALFVDAAPTTGYGVTQVSFDLLIERRALFAKRRDDAAEIALAKAITQRDDGTTADEKHQRIVDVVARTITQGEFQRLESLAATGKPTILVMVGDTRWRRRSAGLSFRTAAMLPVSSFRALEPAGRA